MIKKINVAFIAVLFIVLMTAAYVVYNMAGADADTDSVRDDGAAADFTVEDMSGNKVKLSDFAGRPVVLNFWASWCGPCRSEMPAFDKAYKAYGDDVQFMMVNLTDGMRETAESASECVDEEGFGFPVYLDTGMEASSAYDVVSIPATYFIDADGTLVNHVIGAMDEETLMENVHELTE
ncbi:MAG: TlpA family protein disulfide reductase [Lentihominibacter sp.]